MHALGQVAHFDLEKSWEAYRVQEAVNFHLKPLPIAVLACEEAAPDFDARFSATRRRYFYRILCRRARPVLDANRVWWISHDLDADAMARRGRRVRRASRLHDVSSGAVSVPFAAQDARRISMSRAQGPEIRLDVNARSFLHNQVRSMAGSLKLVGEGKWTAHDLAAALEARDRTRCGPVAPASGLYLARVDYGNGASQPDEASDEE